VSEPPSNGGNSGSGFRLLETTFQAIAVELFQHYQIAIAPMPASSTVPEGMRTTEISATANFRSPSFTGWLSLSVPAGLFAQFPHGSEYPHRKHDFVRELTNQLTGRLKSRMLQFEITLETMLPALIARDLLIEKASGSKTLRWHTFRLLRGDIVATLDGKFDGRRAKYTGQTGHGREGDVILF
jgi:hypothetical protein